MSEFTLSVTDLTKTYKAGQPGEVRVPVSYTHLRAHET